MTATDMDTMTYEEKNQEVINLFMAANGGELRYFGFNGGGPASVKAKNFLRSLLKRHAGRREAELIRWALNSARESGETITVSDVSPSIAVLKSL